MLPTCQYCKTEWTYGESLKNLFLLKCPHCGEKNFAKKFRPRDILFGIVSSIIILFLFPFFDISFVWTVLFAVIAIGVYIATYPINLELTKEEEPLF